MDPDRSFERIYRRHHRDVYGSVLRDVRDPEEAEDVTQVAFLNAFRAMRRGDRPDKPRAWLLTIARNVVRRRATIRAGRPQEVTLDPELLLDLDDLEGSPAEDISAALRRLTDAQREAIIMREIQGRSYGEIAEELGLSVSAVEALIFRARRALAEELELVDRMPTVQTRRKRGLLVLPGLAKLGSYGFSFGRAGVACLVGCAVVATVPVGEGDASQKPAPAVERTPHVQPAATQMTRERPAPTKVEPLEKKKPRKDRERHPGGSAAGGGTTTSSGGNDASGDSGSLLPGDLPSVEVPPVELPSVQAPTVEPPSVTVPQDDLPQLPDTDDVTLPGVGSLTS